MEKSLCPHCGNVDVLEENEVKICLSCGFQSMPGYTDGTQQMKDIEEHSPKIVKAIKFYDSNTNRYWLPTIISIPGKGMVFPEGTEQLWKWAFAPEIVIPVHERIQFPIPGQKDEFYETKLGFEYVEYFEKDDFKSAAAKVGFNED